jgi:hypothetical protein
LTPHQRPPRGFETRPLVISQIASGDLWWRLYAGSHTDPLGFGYGPSRFSDPRTNLLPPKRYGIVYFGSSVKVCFAEAILRDRGVGRLQAFPIEEAEFEDWTCAQIRVERQLDLVDLRGDGPLRMGVPTDVPRARSQKLARLWSRAFWSHPVRPDGIIYESRLNGETNIAIFGRALTKMRPLATYTLADRRSDLAAIISDFDIAVV